MLAGIREKRKHGKYPVRGDRRSSCLECMRMLLQRVRGDLRDSVRDFRGVFLPTTGDVYDS
ncbi:hypothetical protein OIDMADRAFT_20856 [Oidiodendron maius Zn]|uniref:Uncharacterized protein n=1 Tax=Oidiodendron maius (strain Zn) TaxID=913774 RepID=A0A0C3GZQ4_OIDMZ|nr:hypothetical protein OIDMADRAFT_20856 [Oidiodendron maius Zn]